MDNALIFYCIVVIAALLIFCYRQYKLYKSGLLRQFTAICNDRSLVETLLMNKVKQLIIKIIANLVVAAYVLHCFSKILDSINMVTLDVWIGFSLLSAYVLWQQFTYAAALFLVSRFDELRAKS